MFNVVARTVPPTKRVSPLFCVMALAPSKRIVLPVPASSRPSLVTVLLKVMPPPSLALTVAWLLKDAPLMVIVRLAMSAEIVPRLIRYRLRHRSVARHR